jgi:DnaJ-class molecular chaperone
VSRQRDRMGRWALENGPDEPALITCTFCDGDGRVPTYKFAPTPDRPCAECDGEGEIDRDAIERDDE